jgi:hypothetical protein
MTRAALLAAIALAQAAMAAPATYYVRPDGGSAAQCDGRRDAPYRGGTDRACAWRHPFEALPPGGPARIAGGDTLVIGAGSYRMGRGAPGSHALSKCSADWPWDCHLAPLPGGPSPARPTRLVGAGFDRGCRAPPRLWGSDHASTVLDLSGSSNVEIACLDISDHSSCIEFHNAASRQQRCERERAPYGAWASVGLTAADATAVRLRDVTIHGMAHDGIRAGRLRDWTLERVRLLGNGWSGWSGDFGGGASADSGRMRFRDVELAWNGCVERYPDRAHFACWGQEEGGYGDGLGTGATGGEWLFDHVHAHHNAQDGIDLLHADPAAHVVFRHVRAEANAGNQIKAAGIVSVTDSDISGDCRSLAASGGLPAADLCRAEGDSVALALSAAGATRIAGNRIDSEGDCLIGLECPSGHCAGAEVVVDDNRLRGTAPPAQKAACPIWLGAGLKQARVDFSDNTVQATRPFRCTPDFARCDGNLQR